MLIVREAQLKVLRAAARDSFVRSIHAIAMRRLPRLCVGREKRILLELIGRALDKASGFGIDAPDDQVFFAQLALAHGVDFERHPDLDWTAPILNNRSLDGASRLAILADRLPARLHPGAIP